MKYDILMMSLGRGRAISQGSGYGQRCLSAWLEKAGITSRVFWGDAGGGARVIESELAAGHTGVLGLYATMDNLSIVRNVLRRARELGVKTVVGGPQTAGLDEAALRELGCDYIIDGEGELPLEALMRYLLRGEGDPLKIAGLRFIDAEGAYRALPPGPPIEDLDAAGDANPDWLLAPIEEKRVYALMTGRGCPFHCAFCYEGTARTVRLRSVENVMAEIDRHIKRVPETRSIMFWDDTFTLNTERLRAFCRALKERGLTWMCDAHASKLYREPELIDEMVESGLVISQIGIESGSVGVLKAYHKQTTPQMLEAVVRRFHSAGLVRLSGNFIFGGAFESAETMEASAALAERLIEAGRLMIEITGVFFAPYPNTAITLNPERFGMKFDAEACRNALHSMKSCVTSTEALTADQVRDGMKAFNERVRAAYVGQAARVTRGELLARIDRGRGLQALARCWRDAICEAEHVHNFAVEGLRYQNLFNQDAVPIRSFEDLRYEGEALVCADYRLKGLERRLLERANGGATFRELVSEFGVARRELYEVYARLNERCLVYMEEY